MGNIIKNRKPAMKGTGPHARPTTKAVATSQQLNAARPNTARTWQQKSQTRKSDAQVAYRDNQHRYRYPHTCSSKAGRSGPTNPPAHPPTPPSGPCLILPRFIRFPSPCLALPRLEVFLFLTPPASAAARAAGPAREARLRLVVESQLFRSRGSQRPQQQQLVPDQGRLRPRGSHQRREEASLKGERGRTPVASVPSSASAPAHAFASAIAGAAPVSCCCRRRG